MKKFLKTLLKFSAFVLVCVLTVNLVGSFFLRCFKPGVGTLFYNFSGIYGEDPNTIDVLFVGDSEVTANISPMYIWENSGIASYNVGQETQEITLCYENLRQFLKVQSPKIVFLEGDTLFRELNKRPMEEYLRLGARLLFPFIQNHDVWRRMKPSDLLHADGSTYISDLKGYIPHYNTDPYTGPDKLDPAYPLADGERYRIDNINRYAVRKIQALCRREGVELILFSAPSPKNHNWARQAALKALADELDLPLMDLNPAAEDMGLDWQKHTFDQGDHLNHEGAVVLSDYFTHWLLDNTSLPDRREDPAYSSWSDSVTNYHKWTSSRLRPMNNSNDTYLRPKSQPDQEIPPEGQTRP